MYCRWFACCFSILSFSLSLFRSRIVRKPFHPSINVTEAVCVIRQLYDLFGLSTWLRLENQLREKYGLRLVCVAFIFFDLCSRLSEFHVNGLAAFGSALWYHYTPMAFFCGQSVWYIYYESLLSIVCNEFFIRMKYRGPPPSKRRDVTLFFLSYSFNTLGVSIRLFVSDQPISRRL